MSGPLDGVRVIDLTVNVLGPIATQILGDMGADVVKVESPQGDPIRHVGAARNPGMGSYFLNCNRNKRGMVLDLKRPAGRAALVRLLGDADVLVHNMRPSAAQRLGLDHAALTAAHPRLVHASAAGFRQKSRWWDRPAFDDVIQGMSGIAALHAERDGEPRFVPMVIADKFCGYVLASAIGMALFRRERTGRGQEVHVPMLETMLNLNLVEHMSWGTFGEPERGLGYSRMLTPYRRPYPTQDGHICLLANTDEQWARLFAAIERPELITDPRFARLVDRSRNLHELYSLLDQSMPSRSTAEWQERLDAADVPNGPVNALKDLFTDPYLQETGFFMPMEHPSEGTMLTPAVPVAFSESPGAVRRLAPRLGEHTEEILTAAGFSPAEIAEAQA
ncbi:CoA transferase [Dankookia rubra]|uniref:CoA transferase n=1 Tax=Dankookia rubra TaxID=1442381 RepID=A0A4R5QAJ7_9PROT|nr:CoA transferase [Dankookia rubra]TDH60082.1 CoA transferase [Dankookia rubra]